MKGMLTGPVTMLMSGPCPAPEDVSATECARKLALAIR